MVDELCEVNEGRMVWRVWPARERVGKSVFALVLIFLTAVVVGMYACGSGGTVMEGVLWGVGSLIVFGLTLSSYFFPSEFVIDEEGIVAKFPMRQKRMKWRDIRRFVHRDGLGYLSTRSRVSRLDGYRGISIRFGDDEEKVAGRIEAFLKSAKSGE